VVVAQELVLVEGNHQPRQVAGVCWAHGVSADAETNAADQGYLHVRLAKFVNDYSVDCPDWGLELQSPQPRSPTRDGTVGEASRVGRSPPRLRRGRLSSDRLLPPFRISPPRASRTPCVLLVLRRSHTARMSSRGTRASVNGGRVRLCTAQVAGLQIQDESTDLEVARQQPARP
jgi:hypothetical protein